MNPASGVPWVAISASPLFVVMPQKCRFVDGFPSGEDPDIPPRKMMQTASFGFICATSLDPRIFF